MLKDQSPTFHQLFEIGISSSIWLIFAHALDMALAGKKKNTLKAKKGKTHFSLKIPFKTWATCRMRVTFALLGKT